MTCEADEISDEELEAAGHAHDILASEGWGGWEARELAAMTRRRKNTGEAVEHPSHST